MTATCCFLYSFSKQTFLFVLKSKMQTSCFKNIWRRRVPAGSQVVCGESKGWETWGYLTFAHPLDSLGLGLQIHKQYMCESRKKECVELKTKPVLIFRFEHISFEGYFSLRKSSIHKPLELEIVPADKSRRVEIIRSRVFKLQVVTNSEHVMN